MPERPRNSPEGPGTHFTVHESPKPYFSRCFGVFFADALAAVLEIIEQERPGQAPATAWEPAKESFERVVPRGASYSEGR